jgi:hypothetical protein
MSKLNSPLFWPVVNLLATIVTIIINAIASVSPINGYTTAQLSNAIPNYFVPAGWVFSIWGAIYVFMAIFAIYQMLPAHREDDFVKKIGPLYLISSIANSAWILVWAYQLVAVSVVVILILLVSLIWIYVRLQINTESVSRNEWIATRATFSIYLGWISVATVADITALLVTSGVASYGSTAQTWTVLIIVVVVLLTSLMVFLRKDRVYALVPLWAASGILAKQIAVPAVAITAGIAMAVIAVEIIYSFVKSRR